jgi:hypothetical protein
MKLKGLHFADVAKIQEAVTGESRKFQKEEFSAAFQKLYDRAKACMYTSGAYIELTFRNHASYIQDGHTATLQTPHLIYFFNKYTY